MPRQLAARRSLLFSALWCLYFLVAGWAVSRILPVFLILLAGTGFSIRMGSILFYLVSRFTWLIVTAVTILMVTVLVRQFVDLSGSRRLLINRFLIVITIVSAPFVVVVLAFTAYVMLFGPFQLIGKLPQ